jgi:hypothetical protein
MLPFSGDERARILPDVKYFTRIFCKIVGRAKFALHSAGMGLANPGFGL